MQMGPTSRTILASFETEAGSNELPMAFKRIMAAVEAEMARKRKRTWYPVVAEESDEDGESAEYIVSSAQSLCVKILS